MLITELLPNQQLAIQCKYSQDYINRLRTIPSASFDRDSKRWFIAKQDVDLYESTFKGEIVWKTPLWVIKGEPMPDMTKMYQIPDDIVCPPAKITPYAHQDFGVRFMIDRLNQHGFVINADDVGIGKTLQAILTTKHMADHEGIDKIIIICKKSIKTQWIREIQKFSDLGGHFLLQTVDGTKAQRQKAYQAFGQAKRGILVINYHLILHDVQELTNLGFEMMLIDEAHCVKARTGKLNKAIKDVAHNCQYIIFLTGTPIMSRPDDIFGVVQIANELYFGKWNTFKKNHIKEEFTGHFVNVVGYKNLDVLREKVQEILIRRTEYEVAISLPSTVMHRVDCDLDATQKKLLEAVRRKQDTYRLEMDQISKEAKGQALTKEQQLKLDKLDAQLKGLIAADQAVANDPRLFLRSRSYVMRHEFGSLVPASYKRSAKMEALIELAEEILDAGEKLIIFSKFETAVDLMKDELQQAFKLPVLTYSGAVSDEDREIAIQLFNNDVDHRILIGTDAMAEGLNLQVARHVIHFDQCDTPAIKTQRNGRVRRASSTYQTVFVHDLITEQSRDVERLANLERAMGLVDGVVSVDAAQSAALRQVIA